MVENVNYQQYIVDRLCESLGFEPGVFIIEKAEAFNVTCKLKPTAPEASFIGPILKNILEKALKEGSIPDNNEDEALQMLMDELRTELNNKLFGQVRLRFEDIVLLSGTTYEGAPLQGKIVVAPGAEWKDVGGRRRYIGIDTHAGIELKASDFRAIRKFLEGCGKMSLLFGGKPDGSKNACYKMMGYIDEQALGSLLKDKPVYQIEFLGKLRWTYCELGSRIMFAEHLRIYDRKRTAADYNRELQQKLGEQKDFEPLLDILMKQSHGTSILFYKGKDIGKHIENLYDNNRAVKTELRVSNIKGNIKNGLLSISRIDGAFAVDVEKMMITAFGVILDGDCKSPGDVGRGARHNIMKNFPWLYKPIPYNTAVAVVISSDGDVEVLSL